MQSGVSAEILFVWKAVQNPASLSTGGTKKKKRSFPYHSLQISFGQHPDPNLTVVFCQNHIIIRPFKLSSASASFVIPCTSLLFYFSYSNKHAHHTPETTFSPDTALQSSWIPKKYPVCLLQGAGRGGQWHMLNASYSPFKWNMPLNYLFHKSLT